MKKLLSLVLILAFAAPVIAQVPQKRQYIPVNRMKNPPVGTFKKKKDGTIVQYNDRGKKIGEYKMENNTYKKVK